MFNMDHEFIFSLDLLRNIIALEEKKVERMIENYTSELTRLPLQDRIREMRGWLIKVMGSDKFRVEELDEGFKVYLDTSDVDGVFAKKLDREIKKLFPEHTIIKKVI